MIVFCDECGQKHSVELNGEENYVSEYKCNACGYIMKISSFFNPPGSDKNQPVSGTYPAPVSFDKLIKEKSNLEAFLEHTLENTLGKSGFFIKQEKVNGKETDYLTRAKIDLDVFLTDILNNKQNKSGSLPKSNLPMDNNETDIMVEPAKLSTSADQISLIEDQEKIIIRDKDAKQFVTESEQPVQPLQRRSMDQISLVEADESEKSTEDEDATQYIKITDQPIQQQPLKPTALKESTQPPDIKKYSSELSTLIIILFMILVASAGIFSVFYYGIGETIFGYAMKISNSIVNFLDYILAITNSLIKYLLSLIGK